MTAPDEVIGPANPAPLESTIRKLCENHLTINRIEIEAGVFVSAG
jgi:hypothetical protein